jgi:hypothetical protein
VGDPDLDWQRVRGVTGGERSHRGVNEIGVDRLNYLWKLGQGERGDANPGSSYDVQRRLESWGLEVRGVL